MPVKKFPFRYRFTFFQRQFMSHLIIAILILVIVSLGLTYYTKQNTEQKIRKDLMGTGDGIIRLLQQDDDPIPSLTALRTFLRNQSISFALVNRNGEPQFRDAGSLPPLFRNKVIVDQLRAKIAVLKTGETFIIGKNTQNPFMVSLRSVKPKTQVQKEDLFVIVFSPINNRIALVLQEIDRTLVFTLIAAFFLAIAASWLVSRSMSRSVHKLRQATRDIAEGNLKSRSPVERTDELGDLSHDFNNMAEQLESASQQLELFEKRRVRFLVDVTHELRTPLTSIRGIIEGFKNQLVTDPTEQIKYFQIIEKETFRLIRLINELLDLEKVQSGEVVLKPQNHNAKELLEVIAESLEVLIEEKNLQIQIDCDPETTIYGDYDRLTQIFINLTKNSIQFTEFGTIRLSASEDETFTIVEIKDSGKGMSKEEVELIWDRFYKADPSRAKEKSETGLGLSIVKYLVEAHHGSIQVESELGIGTTFRMLFPKQPI